MRTERLPEVPPAIVGPPDPATVRRLLAALAMVPGGSAALGGQFVVSLTELVPDIADRMPDAVLDRRDLLARSALRAMTTAAGPQELEPALRAWGARHRRWIRTASDLEPYVGHALVRALHRLLGPMDTSVGSAAVAVCSWAIAAVRAGAEEAARGAEDRLPLPVPAPARRRWWRRRPAS